MKPASQLAPEALGDLHGVTVPANARLHQLSASLHGLGGSPRSVDCGPECAVPAGRPPPGPLPNEQAALKVLYLVATERRKNRANPSGRSNAWKPILNALTIHYGDRIQAAG